MANDVISLESTPLNFHIYLSSFLDLISKQVRVKPRWKLAFLFKSDHTVYCCLIQEQRFKTVQSPLIFCKTAKIGRFAYW